MEKLPSKIYSSLNNFIENVTKQFHTIPDDRKELLKNLADYVREKSNADETSNLIFICTHNSRRSHMSQIWAQVAAYYYNVNGVKCFSGGTEATAFNPRAVKAMQKSGLSIEKRDDSANPTYRVQYAEGESLLVFSKKYDDDINPESDFCAVMTCSDADEKCPFIPGASLRLPIRYNDPKEFDDSPNEELKYQERSQQIAIEMFFVFSNCKKI